LYAPHLQGYFLKTKKENRTGGPEKKGVLQTKEGGTWGAGGKEGSCSFRRELHLEKKKKEKKGVPSPKVKKENALRVLLGKDRRREKEHWLTNHPGTMPGR